MNGLLWQAFVDRARRALVQGVQECHLGVDDDQGNGRDELEGDKKVLTS